jgi:hypothetical protein
VISFYLHTAMGSIRSRIFRSQQFRRLDGHSVLNARTERHDTPCSLVDTGHFLVKIGYVAFTKIAATPSASFAKSREPALFGRFVLAGDG